LGKEVRIISVKVKHVIPPRKKAGARSGWKSVSFLQMQAPTTGASTANTSIICTDLISAAFGLRRTGQKRFGIICMNARERV
jgi:hypothetical protein